MVHVRPIKKLHSLLKTKKYTLYSTTHPSTSDLNKEKEVKTHVLIRSNIIVASATTINAAHSSPKFQHIQPLLSTMSTRDRSEEDEMRAALQVAVAQICTSEDATKHDGAQMTTSAILTLTELTYLYATTSLANDLVAFSQHASRRTITPDDVLLVARKNPDNLVAKMTEFATSASLVPAVAVSAVPKTSAVSKLEATISVPSRKKPSLSSSSSSSSSVHRQLRDRLLQGTDSENSSDDSGENNQNAKRKAEASSDALLETDSDDNEEAADVTLGFAKREKRKPFTKRKVIESDSSEESDHLPTAQPEKKGKAIPMKPTTTRLSSDEDSFDF